MSCQDTLHQKAEKQALKISFILKWTRRLNLVLFIFILPWILHITEQCLVGKIENKAL